MRNVDPNNIGKLREIRSIFVNSNTDPRIKEVIDVKIGRYPYVAILIKNWSKHKHYEFIIRPDHIGIELHYDQLASWDEAEEAFRNCHGIEIDKGKIIRPLPRGHQIGIEVSSQEDSKKIASLMSIFIEKTIEIINEGI